MLHEKWGLILSHTVARSLIKSQNSQSGSAAVDVRGIWKSENLELKIWSSKQHSLCKPNVNFLLFLISCVPLADKHYQILFGDIKWRLGCVVGQDVIALGGVLGYHTVHLFSCVCRVFPGFW